jgi:hypothetical protein
MHPHHIKRTIGITMTRNMYNIVKLSKREPSRQTRQLSVVFVLPSTSLTSQRQQRKETHCRYGKGIKNWKKKKSPSSLTSRLCRSLGFFAQHVAVFGWYVMYSKPKLKAMATKVANQTNDSSTTANQLINLSRESQDYLQM